MERHRDEKIKGNAAQTLVFKSSVQPRGHKVAKVDLPAIFKIVHDTANNAAASVGRDGGREFESAMGAVRARKKSVNGAGERFGTCLAKGRYDPVQFVAAIAA